MAYLVYVLPRRFASSLEISVVLLVNVFCLRCKVDGGVKSIWKSYKIFPFWGFESRQEQEIFLSPKRPDRYCGPHNLLFRRYRSSFRGSNGRGVKLPTSLHLLSRLRLSGSIPLLSLYAFVRTQGNLYPVFSFRRVLATKVANTLIFRHVYPSACRNSRTTTGLSWNKILINLIKFGIEKLQIKVWFCWRCKLTHQHCGV